jgi:hypothetical protein
MNRKETVMPRAPRKKPEQPDLKSVKDPDAGEPEDKGKGGEDVVEIQGTLFEGHRVTAVRVAVVGAGNLETQEEFPHGTPVQVVLEGVIQKTVFTTKDRSRRDGGRRYTQRTMVVKADTAKIQRLADEKG